MVLIARIDSLTAVRSLDKSYVLVNIHTNLGEAHLRFPLDFAEHVPVDTVLILDIKVE